MLPASGIVRTVHRLLVLRQERLTLAIRQYAENTLRVERILLLGVGGQCGHNTHASPSTGSSAAARRYGAASAASAAGRVTCRRGRDGVQSPAFTTWALAVHAGEAFHDGEVECRAATVDPAQPHDLAGQVRVSHLRERLVRGTAQALPVTKEAVAILRELAAAAPDRCRPDLAASPGNLVEVLLALKRTAVADAARAGPRRLVTDPKATSRPAWQAGCLARGFGA